MSIPRQVSTKTRKVIVVNTLTRKQDVLSVCSEETIEEIRDRYLPYNAHAGSYTWKRLDKGKRSGRGKWRGVIVRMAAIMPCPVLTTGFCGFVVVQTRAS
jgi:hypothetical protein